MDGAQPYRSVRIALQSSIVAEGWRDSYLVPGGGTEKGSGRPDEGEEKPGIGGVTQPDREVGSDILQPDTGEKVSD